MWDLNADVSQLHNPRDQQVADFLDSFWLLDLLGHFWQRLYFCHRQTWWQVWKGIFLRSRCGYILVTDRHIFKTVVIRNPHNFSSNHFDLCNSLLRQPIRCHVHYLLGRRKFALHIPTMVPLRKFDSIFQGFEALVYPPPPRTCAPRHQWMSKYSIHIIDSRASLHCLLYHIRNQTRDLTCEVRRSFFMDSQHQSESYIEDIIT